MREREREERISNSEIPLTATEMLRERILKEDREVILPKPEQRESYAENEGEERDTSFFYQKKERQIATKGWLQEEKRRPKKKKNKNKDIFMV